MATTDQNNLAISMGFKGSGTPQAVPVYETDSMGHLGGYQTSTDVQTATFGVVMSGNPTGTNGEFFCGIPSNYIAMGIIQYNAGIAMIDSAKPYSYIAGQPLTLISRGSVWFATWGKTQPGAIDPTIGCVVICNNTTGAIEFQPLGATAPTGWTVLSGCRVKSRDDTTNGCMLFVSF
jgi:hypothetical protein